MNFFAQLFCRHNYVVYDTISCTFKFENEEVKSVPIRMLVCSKCGKRKVLRDEDFYYNKNVLQLVNLWKKGLFNWEKLSEEETNADNVF